MHLEQIPAGALIVDTDATITRAEASALKAAGVAGVIRCIGHTPTFAQENLSPAEVKDLLDAGLALVGAYQYYPRGGWSASLGAELGQLAVVDARAAGLLPGAMLALDLEGDFPDKAAAVAYIRAWHAEVAASEYAPGVTFYYGPGLPLSGADIDALPAAFAWRSASKLVGEPSRGYVLTQGQSTRIAGIAVDSDHAAGPDKAGAHLCWVVSGDPPPAPAIVPSDDDARAAASVAPSSNLFAIAAAVIVTAAVAWLTRGCA